MAFNGTTDGYANPAAVASTLTDKFVIEAWGKSNGSTAGNAVVVSNGNSSTSGWGIYRLGIPTATMPRPFRPVASASAAIR
jgi:hypothetical protein